MAAKGSRPIDLVDGTVKNLLKFAQQTFTVFERKKVKDAVKYARKENEKKRLFGGLPVLDHLICTAILLAGSFETSEIMVASVLLLLLHESLCDTEQRYKDLEKKFGSEIAQLVRDVSKLNKLSKISGKEQLGNSELLPDLILAMVDGRAVTIKIAERTVRMIALDEVNPEKKESFVKETLRAYVPLSERLNFNKWKSELQHLSFDASDELKKSYESVNEKDKDGKAFKVKLEGALKEEMLFFIRVEYRKKSLQSIHNKMSEKKCDFSKLRDVIGLRIIFKTKDECYKAKEVVEKLWTAKPEFEKDYIKNPLPNGYRSLHLSVKNGNDQFMEIQIRTMEMHEKAERAHWAHKEHNIREHVKALVDQACLDNERERKSTDVESNSSTERPREKVYIFIKDKNNEVKIEEHSTGMQLKDICQLKGLNRRLQGRVRVNEVHASQNYTLKVGDIIKLPISFELAVPNLVTARLEA